MYTIRQAAVRSGVSVPLLRAWERRYRIVVPARTASGYRLYDDAALARLRTMRRLVDEGWTPSNAAAAVLQDRAPAEPVSLPVDPASPAVDADLIGPFVAAAARLDTIEVERVLDAMLAAGTFETVADRHLMPALVALGEAWASGRLDVAAEHAASHAVLRRLSAAFQAAGGAAPSEGSVLVGLPPGARHELGALAFAVAARRAGLPVLYVGPDLPVEDWVASVRRTRARAAVIGAVSVDDARAAADVAIALQEHDPELVLALGGGAAAAAAEVLVEESGAHATVLPDGVRSAVTVLRETIGIGAQAPSKARRAPAIDGRRR
jgi:DNA-binding transcriptional MerR regulator/methylmalonyl-CoA mutase cobalamin-binding subunit